MKAHRHTAHHLSEIPPGTIEAISIDCLIFGLNHGELKVLLAKHAEGISEGKWGLPGGWVQEDESLDTAAARLLKELTGLDNVFLEQLRAFGRVDRFPGTRVITVAYYALVNQEDYHVAAGFSASDVMWRNLEDAHGLIYDHDEIMDFGFDRLKHKLKHEPVGFNLLPEKFTLLQLQEVYEAILSVRLDKPNFRRKMMKMGLLIPCNEKQKNVAHRAAALYRFDPIVYEKLKDQGFVFEM
ncbi:NUDIX hydrolase [Marinimicrobium alkaliphilum]|uniref:NUDIX hydrolase n=1 Tax=Marinimicrobium alkaliphilum TaxID=2202654 RepID=UPI000DB97003|nr:NUDIX domain-containing protein [Marinimicrobium alkaliphilum]